VQPTPTTVAPPDLIASISQRSSPLVVACVSSRTFPSSFSSHRYETTFVHIVHRPAHLGTVIHTSPLDTYNLCHHLRSSSSPFVGVGHPPTWWGKCSASPRTSFYGDRDVREGRECLFIDDTGGEWEREGLGQGLEERLESLMTIGDFESVGVSKA
jgi:hypothetical protein